MPSYFYPSTLITDISSIGSSDGATANTSSQIFLSRGVAGSDTASAISPPSPSTTTIASIFESASSHIMTLGDAAASTVSSERGVSEVGPGTRVETEVHAILAPKCNPIRPQLIRPKKSKIFVSKDHDQDIPSLQFTLDPESLSDCGADTDEDRQLSYLSRSKGKGKEEDISRGRTPERASRSPNPLERAESRKRMQELAIEIDVKSMDKRAISRSSTFFEDPDEPGAVLEDRLLEPCPNIPICENVFEVLNSPMQRRTTTDTPMRCMNKTGSYSSMKGINSPPSRTVSTSTDSSDYQPLVPVPFHRSEHALRVHSSPSYLEHPPISRTSRSWAKFDIGVHHHVVPPAPLSLASQLPAEIIQQVFLHLSPADFNSARHSCRSWFLHSLRRSLLERFLKRMGLSEAVFSAFKHKQNASTASNNIEWNLSKFIARECALGPNWSGNGLPPARPSESEAKSAFVQASKVNFRDFSAQHSGANAASTSFTISSCGKFLMAANGYLVYIYELNRLHTSHEHHQIQEPGGLRPITRVKCPLRVLACSMDTSSHRYEIAILLEGRVGLVCEITALSHSSSNSQIARQKRMHHEAPEFANRHKCNGTCCTDHSAPKSSLQFEDRHSHQDRLSCPEFGITSQSFRSANQSAWQDLFKDDTSDISCFEGCGTSPRGIPCTCVLESEILQPSHCEATKAPAMPIEDGARSVHRNLCSEDDPPRSVAICPQRKCVAFGCSSGIELHWVDALTGQNLNRWFPLTAPSDYLFFLPPRKSVDSAKKLRLISSAARPNEKGPIVEWKTGVGVCGGSYLARELSDTDHNSSFENNRGVLPRLTGEIGRRHTSGRMDSSDHYRAVPLSDGYHILFTDPATGLLCLGSDAPLGGPTKLLRKIWFEGPDNQGCPVVYAGSSDLPYGMRVVAAFGVGDQQSIWLFSIPGDVLSTIKSERSSVTSPAMMSSLEKDVENTDWMAWWPDDGFQKWLKYIPDPIPGLLPRSVWPVGVKGQMIGTCKNISNLSIHSGVHMAIWAFANDGLATVWKLDNGEDSHISEYRISADGTVRETIVNGDSAGELVTSVPPLSPLRQASFDGTSSYPTIELCRTRYLRTSLRHLTQIRHQDSSHPQYDADGDVVMIGSSSVSGMHDAAEEVTENIAVDGETYTRRIFAVEDQRTMNIRVNLEVVSGIIRLELELS